MRVSGAADAGGQPLDGEEARLKAERLRITRMRAQLETALARLQHEKTVFDAYKVLCAGRPVSASGSEGPVSLQEGPAPERERLAASG